MRVLLAISVLAAFAASESVDGRCANGESSSDSALLGAGFSAPPEERELPDGWGLLTAADRSLPIPIDKVGRIGLFANHEKVSLIVLGTKNSEQLWTLSLSFAPSEIGPEDESIEILISEAIDGECNQSQGLLDAFSSPHSAYAFRLGKDIALDAGLPEDNVWNVIWRDSSGDLALASWHLEAEQEGILRAITRAGPVQSDPHPIQELLSCASDRRPYDICRKIAIPGIEVVGWPPETDAAAE